MRRPYRRPSLLAALAVLLSNVSAVAAETDVRAPSETAYWGLQIENDVFASGDDRYYTNGIEISYLSVKPPAHWLSVLADAVPLYTRTELEGAAYLFGQKMFTPEATDREVLIENDRPYAGWLYASALSVSRVATGADFDVVNGVGLTLGIVGPWSYAKQTQRNFHQLIGVDKPEGWKHQLDNELGVALTYARKWRKFRPAPRRVEFEASPHLVAAVGNVYTYAGGGLVLRWGTKLRNDLGPPSISPGFPGLAYFRPDHLSNWYLFGGVEGRAVARNIFLDGNTFSDSHSVDKRIFVGEAQFGVAVHVGNVRFALSHILRTKEFEGQNGGTSFGAINITLHL